MNLKIFYLFLFLSLFRVSLSAKSCLADNQCYEFYTCEFWQCILGDMDDAPLLNIKIESGITKEYDKVLGYDTTNNIYNVVMGSFKLEAVKKDAPFYIKVINMKLERSDNVDIRNIRLVEDQNLNGKYDDVDRVVMEETEYSYGPYTRFIEFVEGEQLFKTGDGMNYIFVADYEVDWNNKSWPAYGKIDYVESMSLSENATITNNYHEFCSYEPVGVNPWGRVLFVDTENVIFDADSERLRFEGVEITSNEDTVLREVSFSASYIDTYDALGIGPNEKIFPDDRVYFLRVWDEESGERLYSLENEEKEKTFLMDHKMKANVPIRISITAKGLICADEYSLSFGENGIVSSESDFFIAGIPKHYQSTVYWDYSECGSRGIGCSVSVIK